MNPHYQFPPTYRNPHQQAFKPSEGVMGNPAQNTMNRSAQPGFSLNCHPRMNSAGRSVHGTQRQLFPHFLPIAQQSPKVHQQMNFSPSKPGILNCLPPTQQRSQPISSNDFSNPIGLQKQCLKMDGTGNQTDCKRQDRVQILNQNAKGRQEIMKSAVTVQSKQVVFTNKSVLVEAVTSSVENEYKGKTQHSAGDKEGDGVVGVRVNPNQVSQLPTDQKNRDSVLNIPQGEGAKSRIDPQNTQSSNLQPQPIHQTEKPSQNPVYSTTFIPSKHNINGVSHFTFPSIVPSSPPTNIYASSVYNPSTIKTPYGTNGNQNYQNVSSLPIPAINTGIRPVQVPEPRSIVRGPSEISRIEINPPGRRGSETYSQSLGSIKSILPPFLNDANLESRTDLAKQETQKSAIKMGTQVYIKPNNVITQEKMFSSQWK